MEYFRAKRKFKPGALFVNIAILLRYRMFEAIENEKTIQTAIDCE